jgi:hypothetical protein
MKQISILAVFLVAFLGIKAQVNPETFPLVTPLATDKVYSQTGGTPKSFLISDIARLARNGVNGQDSAGLGGSLTQNTTINTNSFNFNISHLADGSLNYSAYIFGCQKGLMNYASYNGFEHFVKNQVLKDSCTNYMSSLLGYSNGFTGYEKQISATYNPSTSDNYLQIELNKTTSTNSQDKGTVDFGGGNLFQPTPTIMTIKSEVDYTGDLLLVRSQSQNIFGIDNLGKISAELPLFADDASAGVGGLIAGQLYKTDGTGASPLNVAGIVMIKQ